MTIYTITNQTSGKTLGNFEGANETEALNAMARDAGYKDYRDLCLIDFDPEYHGTEDEHVESRRADLIVAEIKTLAKDASGETIDFDAAAEIMDGDIREDMHSNYAPGFDNPQAFLEEYARRHEAAFDEDFAPYTGGAW